MEKISVIIAAYNTEKYIEKCIDSVVQQTYKNIEIIVVDDKSTDKTLSLLKKLGKKYKNIKIISNVKNGGAAYSRNKALDICTGDYIGFVDSDDYIPLDYYEKLIAKALKEKSDVVICDLDIIYESGETQNEYVYGVLGKVNIENAINNGFAASPCNKLFKSNVVKSFRFPEGIINEDIAFVIPAIITSKKLSYISETAYNYIQRDKSVQNSRFSHKRFDIFKSIEITLEIIKKYENFEEIKNILIYNQLICLLHYGIVKEKSFFYRRKIISEFGKRAKRYNVLTNHLYLEFLSTLTKKSKLFYSFLTFFTVKNFSFLASLLVLVYDVRSKYVKRSIIKDEIIVEDLIIQAKKNQRQSKKLNLSVIIPNYNYEKYLMQRIYSILYQNEYISEIIILDDDSKDNSRELIEKVVKSLSKYINISFNFNVKNSGSVFKQWEKGFKLSTQDYIWIAEADDYSDKTFLSNVIKPILEDAEVVISYCDTSFINADGVKILNSIKKEIDIQKTGHWNSSYVNNGIDEIKEYSYLNCTIANVSSAIIKKGNYEKYLIESGKFKQTGDWLFYVNVMKEGKIAYIDKPLNYYRLHGSNVSSTTKKENHLLEIKHQHAYFIKQFGLSNNHKKKMEERYAFLINAWKL